MRLQVRSRLSGFISKGDGPASIYVNACCKAMAHFTRCEGISRNSLKGDFQNEPSSSKVRCTTALMVTALLVICSGGVVMADLILDQC